MHYACSWRPALLVSWNCAQPRGCKTKPSWMTRYLTNVVIFKAGLTPQGWKVRTYFWHSESCIKWLSLTKLKCIKLSVILGTYYGLHFCSVPCLWCETISYRQVTAAALDTLLQEVLYLKNNQAAPFWSRRRCSGRTEVSTEQPWEESGPLSLELHEVHHLVPSAGLPEGHSTLLQSNPGTTRSSHLPPSV